MKSNLNEKVSNLTEEVPKLNSNFELSKSDFSATRIENNSLNERLSDKVNGKDLEEMCVRQLPKLELILTQMTLRTATVLETEAKP